MPHILAKHDVTMDPQALARLSKLNSTGDVEPGKNERSTEKKTYGFRSRQGSV